ncbi:MAG: cytochrome b/b6 domain-containing protein [Zoogloeaceae bacterium]|jgi:cytochrome b|nr:cytochrome b/b6 domain-containing protein [Zoogloeaceae bacterium]
MKKIKLWDLPTRLFHWLLVASIAALFITIKVDMDNGIGWHAKIGLFVVGLIAFRLAWGFIGSTYARFFQFFPTPSKIIAYLKGEWHELGHNPLGALSVFALLALTAAQAGLGLFTSDDISFQGPLYGLIDGELALTFTGWHRWLAYGLLAFVGLHVASILFYKLVKKHNMVIPMLTGKTEVADNEAGKAAKGGGGVALIIALVIAILAVWGASGAWIPAPPPPAAEIQTPAW